MQADTRPTIGDDRLLSLISRERIGGYVAQRGSVHAAIELYRWNAAVSAAFWPALGHVEVALRIALSDVLAARHERAGRAGSWLDDPDSELDARMRRHVAAARRRLLQRGKRPSEGQTISELGFGFWRFLITRRNTTLWPDLASAFPGAPDRRRKTVEDPVARLHELRNRIAHHQRVWNRDLAARYADVLLVAGYLDADLPAWIAHDCRVPALLRERPSASVTPRR
ncbi:MAG: Abi family protein [Actinobacteria bacterium]|nr:Abi family protein [Actinomycetota bacterium]